MTQPLCIDCKHYLADNGAHLCQRRVVIKQTRCLVTGELGEERAGLTTLARAERENTQLVSCGEVGQYFEAKA